MEIYNNNVIDPFKKLLPDDYDYLIKEYINYIKNNVSISLNLQKRLDLFKKYFEYKEYLLDNKQNFHKSFTYDEQFCCLNIVKYIYETNNDKLKKKLYDIVKRIVLEEVKYIIDFTLERVLYKQTYSDKYKNYKINVELLNNRDYSIKSLIRKYIECVRIYYMFNILCCKMDKEEERGFYYWYGKYEYIIWTDKDIVTYPELCDDINTDSHFYPSMYI